MFARWPCWFLRGCTGANSLLPAYPGELGHFPATGRLTFQRPRLPLAYARGQSRWKWEIRKVLSRCQVLSRQMAFGCHTGSGKCTFANLNTSMQPMITCVCLGKMGRVVLMCSTGRTTGVESQLAPNGRLSHVSSPWVMR